MKTKWFVFALTLTMATNLAAQKDSTSSRAVWAAGLNCSISVGYGEFTQPFKNSGLVTPYPFFPAPGMVFHFDGGIIFRNQWGLRISVSSCAASNLTATFERTLEATYPGFITKYIPSTSLWSKNLNHFALGISYTIPSQRWYFQPEILFGTTEVYSDFVAAEAKELNTHRIIISQMRAKNLSYRSPTLTLGARAVWYKCKYFGFFADARFMVLWHNLQYQVEKTDLIEQTKVNETIHLKQEVFGATASVGVFLQIARWEGTKRNLKNLLF